MKKRQDPYALLIALWDEDEGMGSLIFERDLEPGEEWEDGCLDDFLCTGRLARSVRRRFAQKAWLS